MIVNALLKKRVPALVTELCEDSHNSVTVSVIEAIGRRIREMDEELKRSDAP